MFRDSGLGCGVKGFRGSGLRVSSAGFGVRGSGFRVRGFRGSKFWDFQDPGFRVLAAGFRVRGFRGFAVRG